MLRGPHFGEKGADATALPAPTRTQLTRGYGHDGTASFIRERRALERDGARMAAAQPDLHVAGQAADGLEAVTAARDLRSGVVRKDVRRPNLDGLEATRRITGTRRGTKVLILTTFDIDDYVCAALRGGAGGPLLKDAPPEDLITGATSNKINSAVLILCNPLRAGA